MTRVMQWVQRLVLLVQICVFVGIAPVSAASLSQSDLDALNGNWPNWVGTTGQCATASGTQSGSTATVVASDIKDIAGKYGLQSAIILSFDAGKIADYRADQPPTTPASTMKLIIADVFLRSNLSPATTVDVSSDVFYAGNNDLGVKKITLGDAMEAMLSRSSNVGANVLIKALGGPKGFTDKANAAGYTNTTVKGYYDPSNDGKNSSTIADESTAMEHIFTKQGTGYQAAQTALEEAAQNDNHYNVADDANKWAGTSDVAGNVAKLKARGKDYIIGLYINKSMDDPAAIAAIRQGTADLAQFAATTENSSSGAATSGTSQTACCGSSTVLSGKGNGDKVFNYFIGKGLSVPQVAGIMGNLQIESGFDPTVLNGGAHNPDPSQVTVAWGLGQWLPGSKVLTIQKEAGVTGNIDDLATQLDIMWWEINNKAPTGQIDIIAGLKQINDPVQAAQYWKQYYEGSVGQADQAVNDAAREWANHTPDSSATATASSPSTDSCTSGAASAIVQEALLLSWPDDSHGTTPTPEYAQAYAQFNPDGPGLADCGGFVATVMHATNADPNYPAGGTGAQAAYVRAHPEKYDVVDKVTSISDLQPGDIMIVNSGDGTGADGHTYIFVGPQPPHNYNEASASLGTRAANLGTAVLSDSRGDYMRVRLK